jgi:dolichyl-phosphate beta-glucosyltransferase
MGATSSVSSQSFGLDVSIVIPCYLDAPHLPESVAEIDRVMKNTVWTYELIFVNDCSPDDTASVVDRLAAERPNRIAIHHEVNRGRGAAVMTGLRAARGRVGGYLDIDLEVHARYIPEAVSCILDKGCDVAVGRRDYRLRYRPSDIFRHVLSAGYRRLIHLFFPLPVTDSESGYKFFLMKSALPLIDRVECEGWFWDTEIMLAARRANLSIGEFDCLFIRQKGKRSTVRPLRDAIQYLVELWRYKRRMKSNTGEM